jgi:SAM-dependent methyltransferase
MDVCRRNTARHADQVTYLLCKGDEIPDVDADFAISLGVLHHIPEPASTVQRVFEVLPPGGRFLIWLYGEEGNWLYLKVFNPVRRLFARLPDAVLIPFAHVLAVFLRLYRYLCKFLPLPLHRYMRGVLAQFSHKQLVLTIFDQLNPTFAKYYRRDEAIDLLTTAGFIKVRTYHRHNYSWTLIGEKPRS